MKGDDRFKRVSSYAEVSLYFDGEFNPPEIPAEMSRQEFESEFDAAHDLLIRYLQSVGTVSEGQDDVDFSLNRYVEVRRAINIVSGKFSPEVIPAIRRAQQELPSAYVINLDSHPAYISVLPSGEVIGFSDDDGGSRILDAYGFSK
ncbi:hypothetical protein OKA04_13745 [Luteolibacter flavescens]|uniref:Uncharacterized protein n=1 Tax=Luteolibacter flavescens TaxID=1859460 RepID=A0ABT3FQF2_9BACT|nr:hypothetical protein [Luteolibacter flavescens]MCW1885798.1 hypothetical protein [Luteolibacter flavescens]